eukprot:1147849-Pelagomonas_calceolata.AAC.3
MGKTSLVTASCGLLPHMQTSSLPPCRIPTRRSSKLGTAAKSGWFAVQWAKFLRSALMFDSQTELTCLGNPAQPPHAHGTAPGGFDPIRKN